MGKAFTPGLKVSSAVLVRKCRELPLAGETLVSVGDIVLADRQIARTLLQGELRIVRVAEQLGIPASDVGSSLKVKETDDVAQGEVLAEVSGFWGLLKSTVQSPISGKIEFFSETTGHIGVRAAPRVLSLSAYLSGEVVEVVTGRSVTIQAFGTYAQGIFGVGGERNGRLEVRPMGIQERVEVGTIPPSCEGKVLVGGHSPSIEAIRKAIANGAIGLITGSIDDATLREFVGHDIGVAITGDEAVPLTLIVTEGFGSIAMGERIFEVLKAVNGQLCSINGATQVRAGAVRPEIIVPHPGSSLSNAAAPEETDGALEIGSHIRMIRVPYFGKQAYVTVLPSALTQIETGAWTRVLRAKFEDGSEVTVPRANVELVQR
jgi:hypothetical protein